MTMNAYPEMYLRSAMTNLANMFDFAINGFGLGSDDFVPMFLCSKTCRRLENAEPKFLIGMCGEELAMRVIEETTRITPEAEIEERYYRTPDYWCGRVICYYQWLRNIPYRELFSIMSYEDIASLYRTLHEADISRFADVMDKKRGSISQETNLKRIRKAYGCSQSELSRRSGISLRSIQMYEQRNKDINKGQSAAILKLSRVLGCSMEDLLERVQQ